MYALQQSEHHMQYQQRLKQQAIVQQAILQQQHQHPQQQQQQHMYHQGLITALSQALRLSLILIHFSSFIL
jgi:hypothetical protein